MISKVTHSIGPTSVVAATERALSWAQTLPARTWQPGWVREIVDDVRDLTAGPLDTRTIPERVRDVLKNLDLSRDTIVVWVPGSGEQGLPDSVAEFARTQGAAVAAMPYAASWRLNTSVDDGHATLRAVLRAISRRTRPGQRILLVGESQGAWVVGKVMADPKLARLVSRAALISHPGVAGHHAHPTTLDPEPDLPAHKVREFNATDDIASRDLGAASRDVVDIIDTAARGEVLQALGRAVSVAFRMPGLLQAFVASQQFRVEGTRSAHDPAARLPRAMNWLLSNDDQ